MLKSVGNGFKLFQSSRHDSENEDMLNSENTGAAAKKNWFLSCFGSGEKGTITDQSILQFSENQHNFTTAIFMRILHLYSEYDF